MGMKMVSLKIVCRDYETENIEQEMIKSHLAQMGLYTMGTSVRDLSKEEQEEVESQLPEDILADLKEE